MLLTPQMMFLYKGIIFDQLMFLVLLTSLILKSNLLWCKFHYFHCLVLQVLVPGSQSTVSETIFDVQIILYALIYCA